MLLIADSVMTENRIKINDHLVTSGDQKIFSGDIFHIQHSGLRKSHAVTSGTEQPHHQQLSSTINLY